MAYIDLKNVSVEYDLISHSRGKLFPSFFEKKAPATSKFALNEVNLKFKKQRIGLLGRNGSGKTTLLKVVSGILRPSSGNILTNGTIGSLFTGIPFINTNLSPRENIINYCEFSGYDEEYTQECIADIESFTELGDYFDQPLSFFSSGMQTRFHFALLTSEAKDILVIDEGIGAGDQFFMEKAQGRLDHLYSQASIVLMASHSPALIEKFCDRVLILHDGQIAFDDNTENALEVYLSAKDPKVFDEMLKIRNS